MSDFWSRCLPTGKALLTVLFLGLGIGDPSLERWQNPSYLQLRVQAYTKSPLFYCSQQKILSVGSRKAPWGRPPFAWDSLQRGGSGLAEQEGWSDASAASHGRSPSPPGPVGRVTAGRAVGRVFPRHSPAPPEAACRSISSLAKSWCLKSEHEAALIKI